MSLRTDRKEFDEKYASRSNQTFAVEPGTEIEKIINWGRSALIVTTSPEYGEQVADLFDQVVHRASYLPWKREGLPSESIAGYYKGAKVSLIHFGITPGAYGGSYMDMALEQFRNSPVRDVVVAGEFSSLQAHVRIGDLVVVPSVLRDDDIHMTYAEPDVPAVADAEMTHALRVSSQLTGRQVHTGVCWSCGAGAGIYDQHLAGEALALSRLGVLGNALEAATAYLLGRIIDIRVGSVWLVADSVYEAITWKCPSPRLGWAEGWKDLICAGLDALVATGKATPQ